MQMLIVKLKIQLEEAIVKVINLLLIAKTLID
jgi:hypothetical protein